MNIFTFFFSCKILEKYSPKRTKLNHFKKFIGGACPKPPEKSWLLHFYKNILTPPPNEILDTPLSVFILEVYTWLHKFNNQKQLYSGNHNVH